MKNQDQAHSNIITKVIFNNADTISCTFSSGQDKKETIVEEDVESHDHESISDNNVVLKPIGTDKVINNECQIDNAIKSPTTGTKDFEHVAINQGAQ